MADVYDIVVVGSGPGGLSAAARAAEVGASHILLEAEAQVSNTIYKYQKGKFVMAEPGVLPLRGAIAFAAGSRESILDTWNQDIARHKVNVRLGANVTGIAGSKGDFTITLADGSKVAGKHVVLGIGLQGNLRKLGVPGEDLGFVQYQLDDPEEYDGETIVVVGAGDAAIENAIGLANQNRVILINRNEEFTRCKEGNLQAVLAAIKSGKLECRFQAGAVSVEPIAERKTCQFTIKTPAGREPIECNRIIARLGATPPRKLVESFGIVFPNADPASVPELSPTYESNVPGMYIVGALGGYPLIKQAINQGYEVTETILGRKVVPADEEILLAKVGSFAVSVTDALEGIRRRVRMFSSLTLLQMREILLESEVRTPQSGHVFFRRNDYSDSFYSVLAGEAIVQLDDGRQFPIAAGKHFGELGLLSGRRRAATVIAGDGCIVLETPRRATLKLIASVQAVREEIDRIFVRRAIRAYWSQMITDEEIEPLVSTARMRTYDPGETLFKEGDAPDGLYLLRRGSVTVSRRFGTRDVVLSYVAAGNYLGEGALLDEAPRSGTVRATVRTEAIILDSSEVRKLEGSRPELAQEIQSRIYGRIRDSITGEGRPPAGDLIEYLTKEGIGEATNVLLIDESLCIRCDNCEKACADTHFGTSRLDREAGPTFANVHVPTSCRHCEHPHCMKDCPPDAIRRSADGEVVILDTCIGCGNCQRNCPYGVIQMAPLDRERPRPSLLKWLLTGFGEAPGSENSSYDKSIAKKAVKCDLCKDLPGGPACERACPTGAALRVTPDRFMKITNVAEIDAT